MDHRSEQDSQWELGILRVTTPTGMWDAAQVDFRRRVESVVEPGDKGNCKSMSGS